jgi:hypothetical protein
MAASASCAVVALQSRNEWLWVSENIARYWGNGPMRKRIAMFFLLLISTVSVARGQSVAGSPAKRSSAAVPGSATANDIVIQLLPLPGGAFIPGGETGRGMIELGDASYTSERSGAVTTEQHDQYFSIITEFGLKLQKPNGANTGVAALSAYLENTYSSCTFFLDGIQLSELPTMISARVQIGNLSKHRLEIRVPKTAPAGSVRTSVGWIALPSEN